MKKFIPEVVDQLAEESAFLWSLRDAAVVVPHYLLEDLIRLDGRVEAQLDGLSVMGEPGWAVMQEDLKAGKSGEAFTAAILAFQGGREGRIEEVLLAAEVKPGAGRGVTSALGWLPIQEASAHIKRMLSARSPTLRRIGIAAAAAHRRTPGLDVIRDTLAYDIPDSRARTLRAVGELGCVDMHLTSRANLKANDPLVRFWAAWSTALLTGHADAIDTLRSVAEAGGSLASRAAGMVMRRLPPNEARIWLRRLVKDLGQIRVALIAAGALGDPDAVPFLIDQMKVPATARVAGEALSLIAGAHIAYDRLEGPNPVGFEAGPTEDPEDENVAMDPDADLPWPDPALVQAWWSDRRVGFAKGVRYLLGRPISEESLRQALKTGYQRQRAAAALELAILQPGRPLFEVRAPGFRQKAMLA